MDDAESLENSMFLTSASDLGLYENFEAIGLKNDIENNREVLIKINLSNTYSKNLPRTDMSILRTVVKYIYQHGGRCAITEGASGYLAKNLAASGFEDVIDRYKVSIIDIDLEGYDEVLSYGECHYVPKCFKMYPIRIAIPAASKRKGMVYSNNVKLFVGAVPRKMYQIDNITAAIGAPRPRLHQNLHLSIANLFYAIKYYSPFNFYANGGLSCNENIGEFDFHETFVGNDAYELDCHIFKTYFSDCEYPDYLDILRTRRFNNDI